MKPVPSNGMPSQPRTLSSGEAATRVGNGRLSVLYIEVRIIAGPRVLDTVALK